ncbi:hypothetical protein MHH49_17665 [Paenibacillus sp. FSL F4-0122]|uniref:hypothetical protein n=1 Tax=Paenibacillus TaxID=44249 RepID=UPI0015C2D79C|nr:hypothetical protein [Paenibacillus odorifer]
MDIKFTNVITEPELRRLSTNRTLYEGSRKPGSDCKSGMAVLPEVGSGNPAK